MGLELLDDEIIGLIDRIGAEQQIQIRPVDHAVIGQGLEVENPFVLPVYTAGNTTIPDLSRIASEAQIERIRLRRVFRKDTN